MLFSGTRLSVVTRTNENNNFGMIFKKKQEKYFTLHLHMNEILSYTHLQVFHVSRLLECTNNNILL